MIFSPSSQPRNPIFPIEMITYYFDTGNSWSAICRFCAIFYWMMRAFTFESGYFYRVISSGLFLTGKRATNIFGDIKNQTLQVDLFWKKQIHRLYPMDFKSVRGIVLGRDYDENTHFYVIFYVCWKKMKFEKKKRCYLPTILHWPLSRTVRYNLYTFW